VPAVSFTDASDIRRSMKAAAESLYETAVLAVHEFRRAPLTSDVAIATTTTLEVSVKAAVSTHTVPLRRVCNWLECVGSPKEKVVKGRLKEMLGGGL
jgi:hypothetical protein